LELARMQSQRVEELSKWLVGRQARAALLMSF